MRGGEADAAVQSKRRAVGVDCFASLAMTIRWLLLAPALVLLVLPLASCGPIYDVPGDVCNDPTQNYTQDFAYECNQSL